MMIYKYKGGENMKWLDMCKSIDDYSKYSIENLENMRKRINNELRQYYSKIYQKIVNNTPIRYKITNLYDLQEIYLKEIDRLEYEINNRKGIFSFYSLEGELIDDVIKSDFLSLQKYGHPILIELYIEETSLVYDIKYKDIINIEKVIDNIKRKIAHHKDKKYMQLKIKMYAYENLSAIDGCYRILFNQRFKIKEKWI